MLRLGVLNFMVKQSFYFKRLISVAPSLQVKCAECQAVPTETVYHFFCPSCQSIMPIDTTKTYFEVFNTPVTYDVDNRTLVIQKRHLLNKLHPDKFAQSENENELKRAEDQSALVNEAATILINPYNRGIYLLELYGEKIEEGTNSKLDNEFLMELMELNEEVEQLKDAAESKKLLQKINRIVKNMDRELSETFHGGNFEEKETTVNIEDAKMILEKIKFYLNLEEKLKDMLLNFS